ncbi:MAG: serine/threonine protein kinase [Deltaproteobacteria bacterium]|nr:serine/threonine protein kinase [Deltaproteobacteria bacterium]
MTDAFSRRYRLLERIAIGGTAEVFRASLVADDRERPVVIKRVLPQFARDTRFRRLFLEEACLAASLSHPNIVRVLDHGEIGQTCYIALESVEGLDLGSLAAAGRAHGSPMPPDLAALVAAQVGDALQFIHDHTSSEGLPLRIIHRDVSPQNILVSFRGDVKLTDFGIAKSTIRQEHTVDGTLRGKLDYMAPEQARATAPVDHRADLFGLGCVLYDLLAGVPPFRGDTDIETLDRLREGRIRIPVAELPAPAPLRAVLSRALALDREDRFPRAADLVGELRAYLAALPNPPEAEALGVWARHAKTAGPPRPTNAVDEAIRKLLGSEEDAEPRHASPTSVFADRSPQDPSGTREATSTVDATTPRRSRLRWIWAPLVGLALSGWFLLAWYRWRDVPPVGEARDPSSAARPPLRDAAPGPDLGVARRIADAAGPPQAAGSHRLLVHSRPAGASVVLNGAPQGRTPTAVTLPPGPALLELRKSGHRPYRRRLAADERPSELRAMLAVEEASSPVGYLTVNSLPWSKVYLDGKFVGNTPLVKLQVRSGSRKVQLRGPEGSVRKAFVAQVPAGTSRSFTFELGR